MPDFTSSLYLNLRHASEDLRSWTQLTTGVPAALGTPPEHRAVARQIARLQGCDAATLAPSTLHLFWDLFRMPDPSAWEVFMDSGVYPIATWGLERAACQGVRVRRFGHHDPDSLRLRMAEGSSRRRPIVVADGLCPGCGVAAPTRSLLDSVEPRGGIVLLDDTQALGILGQSPGPAQPYGTGGGGSIRLSATEGRAVVAICSLAKALGVPMAVLSGSRDFIRSFETASETRVHCSPASFADMRAAHHALAVNERVGDILRRRLAALVLRLRRGIGDERLETTGIFPLQTLAPIPGLHPGALHRHLLEDHVRAFVHRSRCQSGSRVSLVINAGHTPNQIDEAIDAIARAIGLVRKERASRVPGWASR